MSPIGAWNLVCNARTEIFKDFSCHNYVKHREPAKFSTESEWQQHARLCYDHMRTTLTHTPSPAFLSQLEK